MPQSVWVKTGALQWWCDWKPHKWVDVRVALEQFTGHDGARDSILFIYYVVHEEKKVRTGGTCQGRRVIRGTISYRGAHRVGLLPSSAKPSVGMHVAACVVDLPDIPLWE